ncbi:3'-5' exoribonuclease [Lysinibacillus sp. CD3-6]|uniref:exonuclease domain-containing protein n=1 Tax=Lysinibacillus TaxID=400634 RepID=UPI00116EC6FC|nr:MULTISPECIES: exonuclease domain-containing protein [Lysinibacillus]MCS1384789.1 exonuclease domain-containing protein [Lysinibacillus sphaericus]UED78403.1 3'-5' exoribonuclease [Lysinibacillus sp. CD3-6]
MNFTTIDFETANSYRGSVCAIGIAKFRNGEIVDKFETLINPNDYFDQYNIEIHGITEEMVRNAPTFSEYFPTLKSLIQDETLVAHYAAFDMSVLRHACDGNSLEYPNFKHTCTYQISKKVWPGLLNYKLNTLANNCNFTFNHHNALEDAIACGKILIQLFKDSNTSTFDELFKITNLIVGQHFAGGYKPSITKSIISQNRISTTNINFDVNHPFYNKTVVFTGTLQSMVRNDAAQMVVDLGGKFSNTVNNTTSFLVVGNQDLSKFKDGIKSSKMKKVESLINSGQEIEIVGEQEFLLML